MLLLLLLQHQQHMLDLARQCCSISQMTAYATRLLLLLLLSYMQQASELVTMRRVRDIVHTLRVGQVVLQ